MSEAVYMTKDLNDKSSVIDQTKQHYVFRLIYFIYSIAAVTLQNILREKET
jgi:hypothetical protein